VIHNAAAEKIHAPPVKNLDLLFSKILLLYFPASSPAPAMKRLDLLPDLLPDKAPEQFLKIAWVILGSPGGKLLADRLVYVE
jgi:hypothetical protein